MVIAVEVARERISRVANGRIVDICKIYILCQLEGSSFASVPVIYVGGKDLQIFGRFNQVSFSDSVEVQAVNEICALFVKDDGGAQ